MANKSYSPIGLIPNLTTYASANTQSYLGMLDFNLIGKQKGVLELQKVNVAIDPFATKALASVKSKLQNEYQGPGQWDSSDDEGSDQASQEG